MKNFLRVFVLLTLIAAVVMFLVGLQGCTGQHTHTECARGFAGRGTYNGMTGWAHTAQWPGHELDFYPDGTRQADGWTFRVNILCSQFTPDRGT